MNSTFACLFTKLKNMKVCMTIFQKQVFKCNLTEEKDEKFSISQEETKIFMFFSGVQKLIQLYILSKSG